MGDAQRPPGRLTSPTRRPLGSPPHAAGTFADMRILVTNDDGIDSIGLHVLARAMLPLGDVTVVAPDRE